MGRPIALTGETVQILSPVGLLMVTVNKNSTGEPVEVFARTLGNNSDMVAAIEGLGRLISLALRSGIPSKQVYKQLRGISSEHPVGNGKEMVCSAPDAIAQALARACPELAG